MFDLINNVQTINITIILKCPTLNLHTTMGVVATADAVALADVADAVGVAALAAAPGGLTELLHAHQLHPHHDSNDDGDDDSSDDGDGNDDTAPKRSARRGLPGSV